MTEKQALLKDIEKWSNIHIGTGVDKGEENCSFDMWYFLWELYLEIYVLGDE